MQELTKHAMDLQGFGAVIDDLAIAEGSSRFQAMLMRSPAITIAGGTDQILRNVIAERVLGLPSDMHADKGMPFSEIPTKMNSGLATLARFTAEKPNSIHHHPISVVK